MKDKNFGIMQYSSINIGDEIQTIAQMRFLPRIDEWVPRDSICKFKPKNNKLTKLIMNAWWMWRPEKFPPSKWVEPLLISMYIRDVLHKTFLTKKTRQYFIDHGPVGCRDLTTYEWLKNENIPAYFSGCLTLTLQPNPKIQRSNYILCVDTPNAIVEEIKKRTNRPVYNFTRMISPYLNFERRLEFAKLVLRAYHSAHCVVSPRLHVIMPSLAFNTPVLRIRSEKDEATGRYVGYENFFNETTIEEFLNNKNIYDFENPPQNPQNHIKMRDELIQKCKDFTGFDRNESFIDENIDPLVEIIKLSSYSYYQVRRILFWAKPRDLLKTYIRKIFGITKFDRKEKDTGVFKFKTYNEE